MSIYKRVGKIAVLLAFSLMLVLTFIPGSVFADAGEVPKHNKTLSDNKDGTYKLELDVQGDADTTQVTAKANVLIIYDTSSSMTRYRANGGNTGPYRADAAENVIWNFVDQLHDIPNAEIEMSLVTYDHTAHLIQNWTTSEDEMKGHLSDSGTANSRKLTYTSGTNYQAGAAAGRTQIEALDTAGDKDPTFVIFITDGLPSQKNGDGSNTFYNEPDEHQQVHERAQAAMPDALWMENRDDTTFYGIYAYGNNTYDFLDDVVYYAHYNGAERSDVDNATRNIDTTDITDWYFNATNTDALEEAIASIFEDIADTLGIKDVSIADGTTNHVVTTTGDISELLEVDETSFEYWISIPVTGSGPYTFTRVNPATGTSTTYTVTVSGNTCTATPSGGGSPITVTGSVKNGQFKFKWEGATELSNGKEPPEATFNKDTGSVDWDLKSVETLLDGVTYSVTFDVYPSQYTYDTLARLENGDIQYSDLDAKERQYLKENGTLYTNTGATLNYTDSRTDDGPQSSAYKDPDPVGLESEKMSISKKFENILDAAALNELDMTVLMSNDEGKYEEFHKTKLVKPSWSEDNIHISTGLMRTKADGTMQILDAGHDFKFGELGSEQYNWELVTPIMHPMIIDGKLTMLIMVDKDHPIPDPAIDEETGEEIPVKTYTLNGKQYYVAKEGEADLEAYNYRRSNLNLKKVVTGEDAPANAAFPFTMIVTNSKADDPSSTDTNSDNYVWFSIYDTVAGQTVRNAIISGATPEAGDTGYYYAKSGTPITVANMQNGWNLRFINLPTETTYSFVENTLPEGFQFKESTLTGQYGSQGTPKEGTAADSTWKDGQTSSGTIQETNTTYQVTYTNDYQLTDLEITKEWNDNSDQDGIRPTAAEFAALLTLSPAVEGKTPTVVVDKNDPNKYIITYTGLPRFNNGQEVTYSVTEGAVEGYDDPTYTNEDTSVTDKALDHGTITNPHEPEKTKVDIEKVWDDAQNQDGKRPTSVTVQLKAGSTAVGDPVTLNEGNEWKHTWSNLDKYAAGNLIEYTADETAVPTGYSKDVKVTKNADDSFSVTVTNSYTPETTEATVKKVWDDANNQDGKRPTSLKVTLSNGAEVTLNADNEWTDTVTNLPKYANGQEIEYTWTEDSLPAGYTLTNTSKSGTITTLTNSYTPEKTKVDIEKVWDDADDQDGKRPESVTVQLKADGTAVGSTVTLNEDNEWKHTWRNLDKYADGELIDYTADETAVPAGYDKDVKVTKNDDGSFSVTVKNSYTPEETEATVKKVWSDANNQDGKRPEELKVVLSNGTEVTLNAENEWTATVDKLPKYEDGGKEIKYTWTEDEEGLPEGYTLTSQSTSGTVTTITNSYTPETTEATVKKVWSDADDQDGKRPKELKVVLSNGTEVTLNAQNEWQATVEDLPKYADGVEIEYTWTEDEEGLPEGYSLTGQSKSGTITTITNSYTPEETEATVKKVWDDADNQDGKRPTSLKVVLSNGTEVTLSDSNQWQATVDNLPKYKDGGTLIEYTWEEAAEGLPDGYTLTSQKTEGTITTLTNSYTPEETEATIKKVWDDANNQDGKRPASLNVTLKGGEDEVKTVTLNKDNGWTATVDKLPKYEDGGKEIKYEWTEDESGLPEGYELTKTDKEGTVTTFTNTYEPEETEAKVVKVWDDADDQDGIRPDSLSVTLKGDGETVETVTLNDDNEWTATINELPVYKDGEKIKYEWTEDESGLPAGYELTNTSVEGTITTFTNSHTPDETEATVVKVWDDADDQDGIRPASLTVTLTGDGETVTTETLNKDNNWTVKVEKLPKNAAGKEIKYEWTEDESGLPEGYKLSDTSVDGKVTTLTNKHTPETVDIPVEKIWEDYDNRANTRPTSIKVVLLGDEKKVDEATLNKDNEWKHTFKDMPKKAAGKDISYDIEEIEVKPYTTEIKKTDEGGFTVTNTYEAKPVKVQLKGTKNISGYPADAPEVTFDFTLAGDNDVNDTKSVTVGNGVTKADITFDEIEFTEPGDYKYTIKETKGGGDGWTNDTTVYNVTIKVTDDGTGQLKAAITGINEDGSGADFSNPYEAAPCDVTPSGVKVLEGRPLKANEFSFELKDKDGEVIEKVSNDKDGNYSFSKLTFDKAGEYKYTISEVNTGLPGVTYDTNVYNVTITVKDDGSGKLKATIEGLNEDGSGADFNNKYKANPTDIQLKGTKKQIGKKLKAGDYTFKLTGDGIEDQTVQNDADGNFEFDKITYTEPGDFTYTVVEVPGNDDHIVYDDTVYTVKVKVTEDYDTATLTPDVSIDNGGKLSFVNIYVPDPTKVVIVGKKIVKDYGKPLEGGEFNFTITGTGKVDENEPEKPKDEPVQAEPQATEEEPAAEEPAAEEPAAEEPAEVDTEAVDKAEEAADKAETEAKEAKAEAAEAKEDAEEAQKEAEEKATVAAAAALAAEAEDADDEVKAAADESQKDADEAKKEAEEAEKKADEAQAEADKAEEAAEEANEELDEAKKDLEEAKKDAEPEKAEAEPEAKAEEEKPEAEEAPKPATKLDIITVDAPLPAEATVPNDADGNVIFGEIEFTKAGTYTYSITESGSMPGVTNEGGTKTVTVVVTNEDGKLVAKVTPEGAIKFTFTNPYHTPPTDSSVTDQIPVNKKLAGHDLKAGEFTFVLEDEKGKVVATAKNKADGSVKFPAITFTKEGNYTYKVYEKKGKKGTIKYDGALYTVNAEVTNNYDGEKLEIKWTFNGGNEITFNNSWSDAVYIDPPVQKVVKGTPDEEETYTFMLEAMDDDNPMPAAADGDTEMTLEITGAGKKEFGKIKFTKPGTYVYKVYEVEGSSDNCEYDGSVYTCKAIVTEDSNYKLHVKTKYYKDDAAISTATFKFVNEYTNEPPEKKKKHKKSGADTGDHNNLLLNLITLLGATGALGGMLYYRRRMDDTLGL